MGVVEALPIDGTSISATALAEKLQVDKTLLSKLIIQLFEEFDS